MQVRTAMSGLGNSAEQADFAGSAHAHFQDDRLVSGSACSSVCGRPISLLRLPAVWWTSSAGCRQALIIWRVDVLPTLPVMPMTFAGQGQAIAGGDCLQGFAGYRWPG